RSPSYRQFMQRPAAVAARFGPSQQAYDAVLSYLRQSGFTRVSGSEDRLLITAQGTRDQINRVLQTEIGDYLLDGPAVFANRADPAVPSTLAPLIVGIGGLHNIGMAQRARTAAVQPSDDVADAPVAVPAARGTPTPLPGWVAMAQERRRDTATPGPGTPTAT